MSYQTTKTNAILAVGEAVSTDTGKMLFALAYDYDRSNYYISENMHRFDGKRPSKASESMHYDFGLAWGMRKGYVDALASLACEMSGGSATMHLCRRIINDEIDMMRERTDKQQEAAPITALYSKAIDW